MRLIDADAAKKVICEIVTSNKNKRLVMAIENLPTVRVNCEKHARFVGVDKWHERATCSSCNGRQDLIVQMNEIQNAYCVWCGAKLDLDTKANLDQV